MDCSPISSSTATNLNNAKAIDGSYAYFTTAKNSTRGMIFTFNSSTLPTNAIVTKVGVYAKLYRTVPNATPRTNTFGGHSIAIPTSLNDISYDNGI